MSAWQNANPMADELFKLVEKPAGYAHISDGIDVLSEDRLLKLAADARDRHEQCVALLNKFIRHHARRLALKRPYKPMPPPFRGVIE